MGIVASEEDIRWSARIGPLITETANMIESFHVYKMKPLPLREIASAFLVQSLYKYLPERTMADVPLWMQYVARQVPLMALRHGIAIDDDTNYNLLLLVSFTHALSHVLTLTHEFEALQHDLLDAELLPMTGFSLYNMRRIQFDLLKKAFPAHDITMSKV